MIRTRFSLSIFSNELQNDYLAVQWGNEDTDCIVDACFEAQVAVDN